jgi:hypothetical protein
LDREIILPQCGQFIIFNSIRFNLLSNRHKEKGILRENSPATFL